MNRRQFFAAMPTRLLAGAAGAVAATPPKPQEPEPVIVTVATDATCDAEAIRRMADAISRHRPGPVVLLPVGMTAVPGPQ